MVHLRAVPLKYLDALTWQGYQSLGSFEWSAVELRSGEVGNSLWNAPSWYVNACVLLATPQLT